MKYSILVPVYNVEKYLEQCLDSLVNQTYRDFEVILADDGSTDCSGQICDEYAEHYPELFRVFHKENEGLLLTRRFSLKQAKGEYILFVDSDDYVSPQLLETVDNAFCKYGCDMVLFNFYRFTDSKEDFTAPSITFDSESVFEGKVKRKVYEQYYLHHRFVNIWLKAVRKDIIDIQADYSASNIRQGEDILQSFPLLDSARKIVFIDEKLYYYRKNPGSMTLSVSFRECEDYLVVAEKSFAYGEKWDMPQEVIHKYAARQMSHFYQYLRNLQKRFPRKEVLAFLKELSRDTRFERILTLYQVENSPKRLRGRLQFMKNAFIKKKIYRVFILTRF